jgi:VIT1/CCC1 family predicted Fe2+/Mn2+ transporter
MNDKNYDKENATMPKTTLPEHLKKQVEQTQRNEITEYEIYSKLAERVKQEENRKILKAIAEDERKHAEFWSHYTGIQAKPNGLKVWFYFIVSRFLGLTFGIKLMERGEERAQVNYDELAAYIPQAARIGEEEDEHEHKLIGMISEERLEYAGSIVLGLNDALVELTGALAGLTFALQNAGLIAIAGLITGISASFSMAASEYLSTRAEGDSERAGKAAVYTGIAYIITVILLILPYLLIRNYFVSLALTLIIAVLIIFFFNYYISVAKDYNFKRRFFEMAGLSLGVAALSFGIGVVIRMTLGIEI